MTNIIDKSTFLRCIVGFFSICTIQNTQAGHQEQTDFIQAMREVLSNGDPEIGATWKYVDLRAPEYRHFVKDSTNGNFLANTYALAMGPDGNLFSQEFRLATQENNFRLMLAILLTLTRIGCLTIQAGPIKTFFQSFKRVLEKEIAEIAHTEDVISFDTFVTILKTETQTIAPIVKRRITRQIGAMDISFSRKAFNDLYAGILHEIRTMSAPEDSIPLEIYLFDMFNTRGELEMVLEDLVTKNNSETKGQFWATYREIQA